MNHPLHSKGQTLSSTEAVPNPPYSTPVDCVVGHPVYVASKVVHCMVAAWSQLGPDLPLPTDYSTVHVQFLWC